MVDTSALVAVALAELEGPRCRAVLGSGQSLLMSAANVVEARIVAARRGFTFQMEDLLANFELTIASVSAESAVRAAQAYRRWGKGFHPARLNFGDCFAYELAQSQNCPLLYVGEDFAQTDVQSAVTAAP